MALTRRGLLGAALATAAAPAQARLKIVEVKAYPVTLSGHFAGRAPKFSSDYDPARWRWLGKLSNLAGEIVVEIKTDQGIVGYGLGGGGAAGAAVIEHHLSELLIGANPLNIELLWDQMYASMAFYGRRGLGVMALSGVDLALWDIAGKQAGVPVHKLLGGPVKDKIIAYYTGYDMEAALRLGFRAFKLPIRYGPRDGREGMKSTIAELKKIRGLIGPDLELMIDVSCQWDVPYTLEMAQRMAEFRLYWIEEPLTPDELDGYAQLCREIRGPLIASGEHEYTRFGFQELIGHRAVKLLQPDTTWSGGLTEVRRIAALAAASGLPMAPHRGSSPYGLTVIMTTPNCVFAENLGVLEGGNELLDAITSRFEKGYYYPNEKPGFGVEFNPAWFRKYAKA
jgi:L-rhamnonate dehydratase